MDFRVHPKPWDSDEDRIVPPVRPVAPFGRSGPQLDLSGSLGPLECTDMACLSLATPPPSPLCFLASHDPHPPDLLSVYLLAPWDILDCTVPSLSVQLPTLSSVFSLPSYIMDLYLLSAMDNLNFTEEEAFAVVTEISSVETVSSSWLVGSVLSVKPIDGDSVIHIFQSVWKAKNVSEIAELRPNFFLIKPSSTEAMDMILKRRPWAVHDDLFSIEPFTPAWNTNAYEFQLMTIWVRVYKILLGAMNRNMGLQLGGCIGKALGIDHRVEGGNMGDFLRIRATPCPLRYERLPRFCYFYGMVGHDLPTCAVKPMDLDLKKLQYWSWLRVKPQQPQPGPRKRSGIEYFNEVVPASEPATTDKVPPPPPMSQTVSPTETINVNRQVDTDPTHVLSAGTSIVGLELTDHEAAPLQAECDNDKDLQAESVNTSSPSKSSATALSLPRVPKQSLQGKYENCRGLGNSSTVQLLGDYVARHTLALIFLCETRLRTSSSSRIQASLRMEGCLTVDFGHGCNGLMLLWNNEIKVNLLFYSATHIDATMDSPTGSFRFTGFHGYYTECMKHLNWSLFDRLKHASSLPWLVGGDFNELLCHSEKEGGRRKPRGLIENFCDCLHRNDLYDYKPSSGWFTFTYSNGSHGTIRERLDHFVASLDWLSRHQLFRVTSTFTAKSDHCILLMDSSPIPIVGGGHH
ncbi:hypothetical protein GQ457_11G029000 [Hibiscus cannabinus]